MNPQNGHPPKLALSEREAAKAIGVSPRTLWQRAKDRDIPFLNPWLQRSVLCVWRRSDRTQQFMPSSDH